MKWAACFLVLALTGLIAADDGWIGNGGALSTIGGKHPTIRMADEVIKIRVGKKLTTVDCLFHFVNDGPSTTVKMGFPDEDSFRDDNGEEGKTVFKKFEAWVDGKKTPVKFETDKDKKCWQTKEVAFRAKQERTIRDTYVVETGAGAQDGSTYMKYVEYILRTGGTWKGSIGRVQVDISFESKFLRPTKIAPIAALDAKIWHPNQYIDEVRFKHNKEVYRRNRRTIFWSGPCEPTLRNGVVSFVTKNLNPTEKDDIFMKFAPGSGDDL